MESIDRLIATEAVRDLIHRYCIEADRGRIDALQRLFTADAVYVFSDREYIGRQGILDLFSESGRRLGEAGVKTRAWHMVTSSAIDVAADTATARTYVLVMADGSVDHHGYYDDEFRREDGSWLISRRKVVLGGMTPGGIGEVLK